MTASTPSRGAAFLVHISIWLAAAAMLLPLLWMAVTSLKSDGEASAAVAWSTLLPEVPRFDNYLRAVREAQLDRFVLNSFAVALVTALLATAHNLLAAYALAKLRVRFRRLILALVLLSMMVPAQTSFLFAALATARLGLDDTLRGLILPFLASGFGILFMRQAVARVPDALLEAGRLDGMGELDILRTIVVPATRPAIATLIVLTFLNSWNSLFWPLVIIDSEQAKTLPMAIADLGAGLYVQSWPVQMAAATALALPVIALFVLMQGAIARSVGFAEEKG